MTTALLTSTEDFLRTHFNAAIEERRPIGPVTKIILDTLLTETASHVGAEELKGSRATDPAGSWSASRSRYSALGIHPRLSG